MNGRSREAGFTPACDFTSTRSSIASFRLGVVVEGLRKALKPAPEPTQLERRVPHHMVGGSALLRGAVFETERIVIDRGLANRPPAETPTQTPLEPDGI